MNIDLKFFDRYIVKQLKRIICFGLGVALPVFLDQVSQAASTRGAIARQGVSTETIISLVVGAIITIFYIRGMYLVLHYASETYDVDLDVNVDVKFGQSTASKILLFGSFMLVVLSALIISAYGWGWLFLYIGPVLCLLGPLVIIVSMEQDLKKYRRALSEQKDKQTITL